MTRPPAAPGQTSRGGTWLRRAGIAASILLGVPLLLVAALLVGLNTAPGLREAERLAASLTGGQVRLTGLHGRVPDALRLESFELRDGQGVWLAAHDVELDWSPLALAALRARVGLLAARQVDVLRLPVAAPPSKKPAAPFRLPVAIDANRIAIADLSLAPPVAGAAAHLSVDGSAHLATLTRGTVALALRRTDGPGTYALQATMSDPAIDAHVSAQEPARGLASMAAHLPELGALGLDATLQGPWKAAALKLALDAGPLRAGATGTIDLPGQAADLAVSADAPAMTLAPGLGWHSVTLAARLAGPFARPAADGTLNIAALTAGGAAIAGIAARITADTHVASLTAQATGVQLPAPNQALLAGGPLALHATLRLDDAAHPLGYGFEHALLSGQGSAILAPTLKATLAVTVPDLERLARPRGKDVTGTAGLNLMVARDRRDATHIALDAAMDVTGGADAPAAARGKATLGATVTLDGADIVLSRLRLDGTTLHAQATGARRAGKVLADFHLAAADLHELLPALRGNGDLTGHLSGTEQDFAASADLSGNVGTGAGSALSAPAPLTLSVRASGLPDHPAGHLQGNATLAGAPLALDADATRDPDQTLRVAINRASWKSARIGGALQLPPGAALPTGKLDVAFGRLDDLRPLVGRSLSGSLAATLDLPRASAGTPHAAAGAGSVHLEARDAGLPGTATIARAVLDARVTDPTGHPAIAGTLAADGLQAGAVTGMLRLAADGPLDALGLKLTSTLRQLAGADAAVSANATLDLAGKKLRLAQLQAGWHDEQLALAAPATLTFAPTVAVDRLRLTVASPGASPASLELAGTLSPHLALTIAARNVTPALARPFAPSLDADGTLLLDARLGGTPAAPTGTVRLQAAGLRLRTGPGRGLPPAALTAAATLAGGAARLDAQLAAGNDTRLNLRGSVPLAAAGPIALRADGGLSLALLDPILTPDGRRVRGQVRLDATIGGTIAAPVPAGTLNLSAGEVQDYAQGIHITDIAATLSAQNGPGGAVVRVERFNGRAGGGTVALSGQIGLAGAMPVDLRLTADNARPITSDLVTATLDAALSVTGNASDSVTARGRIHVRRADIQVPDKLPASVAVLNVRRPGDRPPARAAGPGLRIPLDISLDAPQQVFVRGRGLDAELGGALHVGGTAAAPQTAGSIDLRRGTYSLAGQSLTFTSGSISFNGSSRIDPALDLVATSSNSEIVATLTVGGYASAPKISLTSVPDRPQDEVLAALLFHQSAASLSPFQLAQIAAALAQVSGVGGGGPDPIARLRKGLGLDRLSVGSSGTGSSATTAVEAGRYVAPGVYLGAKQGTSGAQTQAEVQIDITKGLKLNSDVGSGPGGNNVGLTYQFQY